MKFAPSSVLFFLLSSSLAVSAEEHASCACEAKEHGFTIDCANQGTMNAAVNALLTSTPSCATDCSSSDCIKNFFIVQAHHDYCLEDELPTGLEDAQFLTSNSCINDCSANTGCKDNFYILKAVHDLCDEDALSQTTELGYHDMEEVCEGCNVKDNGDTDADELICQEPSSPSDDECPEGAFLVPGLGCFCFSGTSTVETPTGAMVALSDLALGEYVKTKTGGVFEPVYGFAHYAPQAEVNYHEISTTSTATDHDHRKKLQVSAQHMIRMAVGGSYVPAGSIRVGDVLYGGHDKVTKIRTGVKARGAFAPYTPSGTIVVDGIEASCYVVPDMNIAGMHFTGQWLAHTFEFPHRVACYYLGSSDNAWCNTYNAEGISTLKEMPMGLYNRVMMDTTPTWMQTVVLSVAVLILTVFAMTEFTIFKHPSLLFGVVAVAMYYTYMIRIRIRALGASNKKHIMKNKEE